MGDLNMTIEYWKPIEGYEGLYSVSNLGRVKSLPRPHAKPGILAPAITNGYPRVCLRKEGQQKCFTVHRLVCTAFHGPCPPGMECCHGDGNRTNASANNLRWDTSAANQADRVKHGTIPKGEKSGTAKLTTNQAKDILSARKKGELLSVLAKQYGVSIAAIGYMTTGKTWKHVV